MHVCVSEGMHACVCIACKRVGSINRKRGYEKDKKLRRAYAVFFVTNISKGFLHCGGNSLQGSDADCIHVY